jgi:hypothetical protein
MSPRWFCGMGLIVAGAVAWSVAAAPAPPPKPDGSPSAAIYRRADFPGIDDPKTTLQEALDKIGEIYNVQFEVNEKAFKFEQVDDVLKKEVASPNPVAAAKNLRLDALLPRILGRVVVSSGATFLLRRDSIQITTGLFRETEIWGTPMGPCLPLVHQKFEKVPLEDALKQLSDLTDFNIVLDPRAGEKSKAPVTARFLNTPLDTAVRFLADMANLRSLQQDNLLYVTSKENAAVWEARLRKEKGLDNPLDEGDPTLTGAKRTGPRLGTGPGVITVTNPGGA